MRVDTSGAEGQEDEGEDETRGDVDLPEDGDDKSRSETHDARLDARARTGVLAKRRGPDTSGTLGHLTGTMLAHAIDSTAVATSALTGSLDELAELLGTLDDATYGWKPEGGVSGSIGAHVRHVLDHVRVLVDEPLGPTLTYDRRERDTTIERDRRAGIDALRRAGMRLRRLALTARDEPMLLEAMVERGQPPIAVTTSLARELVFALQHTIHHQAIIAVLLRQVGGQAPEGFGYAPATPVH